MLTKEQKELLIDLIDGYFYPRDLIKDYEKFFNSHVRISKLIIN